MTNNCINNDCVDEAWLANYWRWRWLLPLLLLIPLLFLLLRGCNTNTGAATTAAVVPTAVPAPACDTFSGNAIAGEEVTFTGSTESNGTIRLVADSKTSLGSTEANGSGDWSLTTKFLRAGTYNVVARLMDGDTVLSSCSGQSVTVSEPAMAEISKPTVDRLGTQKLGALALAGTGTAGSLLEIYCNGASIGTTTVGANGQWVFDTAHDEAGEYEYAAFAKDDAGNILISDSATAIVEAPPEPVVEATAEPEPTPEPVVEATPEPEPVAECIRPVISSASGGQPVTEPVAVTGTASPDSEIVVFANGVDFATTTTDADGNWTISAVLGDDTYDIVARSACVDGATKQSNTATLVVGSGTPAEFTVEVAEEPTVEDPGVALEGSAPEGELSIFTGETLLGTTTSLDGTWDFVSTCSLAPGEYELNVTASDGSEQTVTVNVPNLAPAYVPPAGDASVTYEKIVCTGTPDFGEIIGTTYIVAQCESMSLIAQRMGTTLAEIIRYNPQVTDPGAIYGGQLLNIPVGASCLDG